MNGIDSIIGAVGPQSRPEALQDKKRAELKDAVAEFEAIFINQMLKSMRDTVMKGDLFHGGSGEDIYNSLLDVELSKQMAHGGGIGLEKTLMRQLGVGYEENEVKSGLRPFPATLPGVVTGGSSGFLSPVANSTVSSGYGFREDPVDGSMRFHHGIDIAAREGSPVYVVAPGRVVFSGNLGGYGNLVEVAHENGLLTRYGHNQENLVKQGDSVNTSDPIAYVGSTGRSTGAHLHFEVRRDGDSLDPERVLRG